MKPIELLRKETPGCSKVIHFNNAGASLAPQSVTDAIQNYIQEESLYGGYEVMAKFYSEADAFYSLCAELLNCGPENIAFVASATDAYSRALSSIPFQKGDIILTTNDDYISNQIFFLSMKKRIGIKIIRIGNTSEGELDLQAMQNAIREHQPKLVAVTHVPTNSGLVQPVELVGAMCAESQVLYLVDACQSAGQLMLDVQKINCDFLAGTMRKFMRGPRGAGFLYVSDRALTMGLEPLMIDMRGAEWTGDNTYKSRMDAKRFEEWERSYAIMMGSVAALRYILEQGMSEIQKQANIITTYTRQQLAGISGIELLDKGKQLCNIITIRISGWESAPFKKEMDNRKINCSLSFFESARIDYAQKNVSWALRVSPHYYNTTEEVDILVKTLHALSKEM